MAHNLAIFNTNLCEKSISLNRNPATGNTAIGPGFQGRAFWRVYTLVEDVLQNIGSVSNSTLAVFLTRLQNHQYVDLNFRRHVTPNYNVNIVPLPCTGIIGGRGTNDPENPSDTQLDMLVNGIVVPISPLPANAAALAALVPAGSVVRFRINISLRNMNRDQLAGLTPQTEWFDTFSAVKGLATIVKELATQVEWLVNNLETLPNGVTGVTFGNPGGAPGLIVPADPQFITNLFTVITNWDTRWNVLVATNGGMCLSQPTTAGAANTFTATLGTVNFNNAAIFDSFDPNPVSGFNNPLLNDVINFAGKFMSYSNECFTCLRTNPMFNSFDFVRLPPRGVNIYPTLPTDKLDIFHGTVLLLWGINSVNTFNDGMQGCRDNLANRFVYSLREMLNYAATGVTAGGNNNNLLNDKTGSSGGRDAIRFCNVKTVESGEYVAAMIALGTPAQNVMDILITPVPQFRGGVNGFIW